MFLRLPALRPPEIVFHQVKRPSEGEYPASGLICLKGGDLAREISESSVKPKLFDIHELFPEEYFSEKYILYVHR